MRLRIDLAASVPKDAEQPSLNEDAWAINSHRTCLAVSDGASESYDSRRWARLLVDKYADDPAFSPAWVESVVSSYNAQIVFESLSWSQQAAFSRGSFATLLGLQLADNGQEVEVLAIGDSLACHVRDGRLLATYPYVSPEEFDARPDLLSTVDSKNNFLQDVEFFHRNSSKTWFLKSGDLLFLLTDAVGQWLLREHGATSSALDLLVNASEADLSSLVSTMRDQRRMRYDDSTVLRLAVEDN